MILIGKKARVIESKNKNIEGIEGKIIKESKNMIYIETNKGIKKIIKEQAKLEIDGKKIKCSGLPYDRIKK